ncbi:MAG: MFS transporter [Cyclobacteriaceae bacterium]
MTQAPIKAKKKNRRALALLFTANGISGFAQGVTMLSVPWYFAQQGISSQFNLIYGIITFITIFWGLWAGTIVDRFDRKQVFLYNNIIEGSLVLLVAAYGFYTGNVPTILIVLVFAVTIFGFYLHYPTLYAFVQEISAEGEYTKVTSYVEIVGQTTNVIAGAMAALLLEGISWQAEWHILGQTFRPALEIEVWSIQEIFLMDGITYFISVILISLIQYVPLQQREVEKGQLSRRLRTGFNFLKAHPLVLVFGICSHNIFVVMLVKLHAVMPMYITNHLEEGGEVFGIMEVLYALGALSAGIFVSRLFRNIRPVPAIVFLLLMATVALLLSAFTRSVGIFLLVGLMIGFANAGSRVLRLSYLFSHVPNQVIGRVNSIFSIINVMLRVLFISLFSAAFFAQGSNIVYAYVILSVFTALSAVVLLVFRKRLALV